MFVIDITRNRFDNDILCGNNSMDSKNKTLNYVIDYALANYNIDIDKNILDEYLDIKGFSLKKFLENNYSISIDEDLIIQSIVVNKDNCIFIKYIDDNLDTPQLYSFNKKDINVATTILTFLVNDGLIKKYENNLSEYERTKLDYNQINKGHINLDANIKSEMISLYDYKGMFLEELLSNTCSLNQLKENDKNLFI